MDLGARFVTVQPVPLGGDAPAPQRISYDALVVAVGSRAADAGVPGARERCFALKDCEDARRLREAVGERFERAARAGDAATARELTFAVVGGGATGVELAGELSDFVNDVGRLYPSLPQEAPRVVLVHSGDELLPQFDPDLRIEALRALERRGVLVGWDAGSSASTRKRYGSTTTDAVWQCLVLLRVRNDPTPSQRVDTRAARHRSLHRSSRACRGRRPTFVDGWPRRCWSAAGTSHGLGDAFSAATKGTRAATARSQAGQVSGQRRGCLLTCETLVSTHSRGSTGRSRRASYRGATAPSVRPPVATGCGCGGRGETHGVFVSESGALAYVGGGEALSQVQVGDARVGAWAGSAAFILWRSVYIVKQVATRNRVLVTFDWVKTALFGRDITRL